MVLQIIKEQMDSLAIPYEFGEWTSDVVYPYSVGELIEPEAESEDGLEQPDFILTFFHRAAENPYAAMEDMKNKIKKHFRPIHGLRVQQGHDVFVLYYGGASYIPTGEADLKRLQIDINIKHWKGEI